MDIGNPSNKNELFNEKIFSGLRNYAEEELNLGTKGARILYTELGRY